MVTGVEGVRHGTELANRRLAARGRGQDLSHVQGRRGEIKYTLYVAGVLSLNID